MKANPEIQIGKSYVITCGNAGDYKKGDVLKVLAKHESYCSNWVVDKPATSGVKNACIWVSSWYTFEEVAEDPVTRKLPAEILAAYFPSAGEPPRDLTRADKEKLTAKVIKKIEKRERVPEYRGDYAIVFYFTNGKKYHARNVMDYMYAPADESTPKEFFTYRKKDVSNRFVKSMEVKEVDTDTLAGISVHYGASQLNLVLKPCFHKKHKFETTFQMHPAEKITTEDFRDSMDSLFGYESTIDVVVF